MQTSCIFWKSLPKRALQRQFLMSSERFYFADSQHTKELSDFMHIPTH